MSIIIPIPKGNYINLITNYRGITLGSIMDKESGFIVLDRYGDQLYFGPTV